MTASLTGLEFLRALIAGEVPPPTMAGTLGFTLKDVSEGFAVFEGLPSERVLNPAGFVHGGWLLTIIDSACGCAAHTTLAPGDGYTTVETKTNFVRPVTASSGLIRAEGRVVALGNTIITAEARAYDVQRRLVGHGTSTLMVLRKG